MRTSRQPISSQRERVGEPFLAREHGTRDTTFVLDGQQRRTSLLVGLQGSYLDRLAAKGSGARTDVMKKLHLNLLYDGRVPDSKGDSFYDFRFLDSAPMLAKSDYWFEVGRILDVGVERERVGDVGLGVGRRHARAVEQRRLHRIVPARHSGQHSVHRVIVFEIASAQQRQRADRQRAAQEQPPRNALEPRR
jgi:hypothetical protein